MVLPDREEELVPASVAAELREEEEDQSDPAEDLRSNNTAKAASCWSGRNLDANSSTSSASPAPSSSSPNLHTLQFINTCECCTERPADWWCPADQAYFCHSCDQSVHSANAFSSRHERERISPDPLTGRDPVGEGDESDPEPVLSGCKRKSSGSSCPSSASPRHKMIKAESEILPEEDSNPEEVDEDVFQDIDLFLAEDEDRNNNTTTNNNNNNNSSSSFSSNPNSNTNTSRENEEQQQGEQQGDGLIVPRMSDTCDNLNELLGLSGFDPQEEEDESRFDFAIRKNNVVRLIDGPDEVDGFYTKVVKLEDNHLHLHHHHHLHQLDVKPKLEEEEDDAEVSNRASEELLQLQIPLLKKSLLENPKKPWLKLDVKDVQSCWQSGLFLQDVKDAKPLAPLDSISDAAGSSDVGVVPDMSRSRKSGHSEEQAAQVPVHMPGDLDSPGGREARVSRYREKRRTRLFSKKIRYEVRKLNAERRPRLKGRFVKRSPVGGS